MDNMERVGLLEEAAEELMEVIDKIRQAVRGTSEEARAQAYIIPHLSGWIDGREMVTITSLIEALGDEGNDWDEDFEDDEYLESLEKEEARLIEELKTRQKERKQD